MKRLIQIILLVVIVFFSQKAFASAKYGDWASKSIENAISNNIIELDSSFDYYSPITRLDLANIIARSYINIKGDYISPTTTDFTDISNTNIDIVSGLGIMNGYGDGTFLPDATALRQEMAKILLTYQAAILDKPLTLSTENYFNLIDFEDLSNWAKPYVSTAVNIGLLNGYEDGSFGGLKAVSWQEAIVMIERVAGFNSKSDFSSESYDFNLKINSKENVINVSWNIINDDMHTLTITEQRLSRYPGDIPPNTPLIINFTNENTYTFSANPNKVYTIRISNRNRYSEKEIYTNKVYYEDMNDIYSNYPTSLEEAEPLMVSVTVPVWKLNGSTKVPSSVTFKIHNSIAEKVKLIFEEIFNGDEKFPIKDIGGYSWRGGRSEHNGGTAIDINSNENYCIYNNGTTIGSHWKPYEDPYSITPYGDVIKAFEKYGFTWGGDSWSNPKDYMHFSYLGT